VSIGVCGDLFPISDLRREVIVGFVDVSGIVDHHCLNFLFINIIYKKLTCASGFQEGKQK
jgi:hypothetical protein